jgi:hypothetical protein
MRTYKSHEIVSSVWSFARLSRLYVGKEDSAVKKLIMGSYGKIWYLFLLYLFTFHSFAHVLKKCMSSNHRMSLKVSKRWILIAATLECRWWSTTECWLKLCQDPRLHFVPVVFYIKLSCQLHPDDKRLVFLIRQGSALRWRYASYKNVSAPKMALVSCHPLPIWVMFKD